jgi:hypothetical protein
MKHLALLIIVSSLCDHDFMCGYLGDTSPEFQEDAVSELEMLSSADLACWLQGHRYNLVNYCKVSSVTLAAALS